jgi:hypothetical protein
MANTYVPSDPLMNGSQVCGINAMAQLEHIDSLTAEYFGIVTKSADQMQLGRTLFWTSNRRKVPSPADSNSYRPDTGERIQFALTTHEPFIDAIR